MVGVPSRDYLVFGVRDVAGGVDRVLNIAVDSRRSWSVISEWESGYMGTTVGMGDFDENGVKDLVVNAGESQILIYSGVR
jgi:hypothetical protein